MLFKKLVKLFFIVLVLSCKSQISVCQNFQWAKGVNPQRFEASNTIAADSAGNSYFAGYFFNQLQTGSLTVSSPGYNLYIAKFDPSGNALWVTPFPVSGVDPNNYNLLGISDIKVDKSGNCYFTGYYQDEIIVGNDTLICPGGIFSYQLHPNLFLGKLDTLGNVLWVKEGYGPTPNMGLDIPKSLSLDSMGNVYVSGTCSKGEFIYDGNIFTNVGNAFIMKADSNGQFEWGRCFFSSRAETSVNPSGNGYLKGELYGGMIDLGNGVSLTASQIPISPDNFVAYFNSDGEFQWIKNYFSSGSFSTHQVKADNYGNAYLIGLYNETFTFDSLSLTGDPFHQYYFLLKISNTGNLLWHNEIKAAVGNPLAATSGPLAELDKNGDFILATPFRNTIQITSENWHYPLFHQGANDLAVMKFSSSGSFRWSQNINGWGMDGLTGLAIDGSGNIFISGIDGGFGPATPTTTTFGHDFVLDFAAWGGGYITKIINATQITGKVFIDLNGSNQQELQEPNLDGETLSVMPGNLSTLSQPNGKFNIFTDTGNYQITLAQAPAYYSLTPATHSASFASLGLLDSANHFALQPAGNFDDLKVSIAALNPARPGFTHRTRIFYKNVGTTVISGTVSLTTDTLLTFTSALPAPATITGNNPEWNFTNLQPFEVRFVTIDWHVHDSTALGTQLALTAIADPVITDQTPADNSFLHAPIVQGSYDPNDKQVSHQELTLTQVMERQPLTFMVRFQNTGTDTAFTVMVRDEQSVLLDMSTLEIIAASHPYQVQYAGSNTLQWQFSNILLPDSNVNEPASHGYVLYRVQPLATLTSGQLINTSAKIYFDFNAPVATNVTRTVVVMPSAENPLLGSSAIQVYPNPNNGSFTIELEDCKPGIINIKLTNLLGQEVYTEAASAKNSAFTHQLNVQNLSDGVYLLQVMQGEKMMVKRVVKQK